MLQELPEGKQLFLQAKTCGSDGSAKLVRTVGFSPRSRSGKSVTVFLLLAPLGIHPGFMHKFSTAVPPSSALTALGWLTLLDVLHKYDCGTLRHAPCQHDVCGTSLQKPTHNPGQDLGTLCRGSCKGLRLLPMRLIELLGVSSASCRLPAWRRPLPSMWDDSPTFDEMINPSVTGQIPHRPTLLV